MKRNNKTPAESKDPQESLENGYIIIIMYKGQHNNHWTDKASNMYSKWITT
jgi:hypothetical protein